MHDLLRRQDELWAEISRLRKRCAEQDEQINKQERAIGALQQTAALRHATAASTAAADIPHEELGSESDSNHLEPDSVIEEPDSS